MSRRSQRVITRESKLRPSFKTIQGTQSTDNNVQTSDNKFHAKKAPRKSCTELNNSCRTTRNSKKSIKVSEQIESKGNEDRIQKTNSPKKTSKKATTVVEKKKKEEKLDSGKQTAPPTKNSRSVVMKKALQKEKSSGDKRKEETIRTEQVPIISNDNNEDCIQKTNSLKKSSKKAATVAEQNKKEEKLDSGKQSPPSIKNSKNVSSPIVVTKKASQNEKLSDNKHKKEPVKSEQVPIVSNDDKLLQNKFNPKSATRALIVLVDRMQNKTEVSMQNKKVNFASVPKKNNMVVKQNDKKLKETGSSEVKIASNTAKSPLISKLRTRKTVKYAESSLEMSQTEGKPNEKKIPIYKQIVAEKPTKRKGDLYEFNEDIEKYKERKKLKRESDEYNKTIQSILKNIANKNKLKKKNIFHDKKNKKTKTNIAAETNKNKPHVKPSTHKHEVNGIKENVNTETHTQKFQNVLDTMVPLMVPNNKNYDTDNDDCFGFVPSDNVESPKVKIISNIPLHTRNELNFSIGSPTLFNKGQPNANSTMLNNRQPNTVSINVLTPWRFNEMNVKRNPHFISLKDSSLPCICQEMVLDHTLVDKFEDNISKNVTKKNMTNKKINEEHLENKENTNNLFDIELSPIKTTNKISFRSPLLKRKILGEKNDNVIESEVPSFGFNTSNEEIPEPVKNKEDGPFRFSINICDKKYERKKMRKIKEKIESPIADSEESDSNSEGECGDVKLFEDFTSTQDRLELSNMAFKKNRKSRKRKDKDVEGQKKRKNIRTKEEEEEAEKWAVAFNSMCEEIDQFPLEVE